MNTTVLSIQPGTTPNSWDVSIAIPANPHHPDTPDRQLTWTFHREPILISDRQGWALTTDPSFYKTFQFNHHITHQIQQLLRQFIAQQPIPFPTDVGQFYSPEEAHREMEHRQADSQNPRVVV